MNTPTKNNLITAFTMAIVIALVAIIGEVKSEPIEVGIAFAGLLLFAFTTCLQNARVTSIDKKLKSFNDATQRMTDHILKKTKADPETTFYTPPTIFRNLMTQYVKENIPTVTLKNLIETTKFEKDSFLSAILEATKCLNIEYLRLFLDEGKININTTFEWNETTLLHKAALMFPSIKVKQEYLYTELIKFLVIERGISREITTIPGMSEICETAADIFKRLRSKEGALDNDNIKTITELLDPSTPIEELKKLNIEKDTTKPEPKETLPIPIETIEKAPNNKEDDNKPSNE